MYLLYLLGHDARAGDRLAALRRIYFTALLAGSFGALFATAAPSLGASGAIFGLMGAAVVELRARRLSVMESGIGGLIVINLILSFSLPNISIGAHIGGLIGGALAALGDPHRRRTPRAGARADRLPAAARAAACSARSRSRARIRRAATRR